MTRDRLPPRSPRKTRVIRGREAHEALDPSKPLLTSTPRTEGKTTIGSMLGEAQGPSYGPGPTGSDRKLKEVKRDG